MAGDIAHAITASTDSTLHRLQLWLQAMVTPAERLMRRGPWPVRAGAEAAAVREAGRPHARIGTASRMPPFRTIRRWGSSSVVDQSGSPTMPRWPHHLPICVLLAIFLASDHALALEAPSRDPGPPGDASGRGLAPAPAGSRPDAAVERPDDAVDAMAFIPQALRAGVRDRTGTSDLTPYLRAAFASGRNVHFPAGRYPVCDGLTLASGQRAVGEGVTSSVLWAGPCFNLAAPAVVTVAHGDSSGWDGIGIGFDQAAATSRATLRRYPWALDIRAATRFKIGRIRVSAAYDGIRGDGNCGGLDAGLLEIGAFNRGLLLDGPQDFTHIGVLHAWPFDVAASPALMAIYLDGATVAAEFGRVDGLDIRSLDTFGAAVVGNPNGNAGAARQVAMMQLDGDGATFANAAGDWQIGLLSSTKSGRPTAPAVSSAGGTVLVGSARLWGATRAPYLKVTGGSVIVSGGSFEQLADQPAAEVVGGTLVVTATSLRPHVGSAGPARSRPFLAQGGQGTLIATNNAALLPASGGGGPLVGIGTDHARNVVTGNVMAGWGLALPPGAGLGSYGDNAAPAQATVSGVVVGRETVRRIAGRFDGSGRATLPHGLGDADRIVGVTAIVTGRDGARSLETDPPSWDGRAVTVTGPAARLAHRPVEVVLRSR